MATVKYSLKGSHRETDRRTLDFEIHRFEVSLRRAGYTLTSVMSWEKGLTPAQAKEAADSAEEASTEPVAPEPEQASPQEEAEEPAPEKKAPAAKKPAPKKRRPGKAK